MDKEELIESYIKEAIEKGISIDKKGHTTYDYKTRMNNLIERTYIKIELAYIKIQIAKSEVNNE